MSALRAENFRRERPLEQTLRFAARHVDRVFGRLFTGHRLTNEQWAILTFLRERPLATATDIALAQGLDAGSLSRSVEGLVRRGFVDRMRSQNDRRIVMLFLTQTGGDLLTQLLPEVDAAWDALLNGFEEPEIRFLTNSLRRLSDAMAVEQISGFPGKSAVAG